MDRNSVKKCATVADMRQKQDNTLFRCGSQLAWEATRWTGYAPAIWSFRLANHTLLILVLGAFSIVTNRLAGLGLIIFGLAVFIAASVERWLRWRDIKQGASWHTYSRGISWFNAFLPLRETTVKRFIDPAAAIIGLILSFPFGWLGYYIIFSAACLFIFESSDYQRSINRMLDTLDSLIESEVVSENVAYYSGDGAATERPIEQTAGIPTGTDPDLAAAIGRRRARSQPLTKDSDIIGSQPATYPPPPEEYQTQTNPRRRQPPDNLANS